MNYVISEETAFKIIDKLIIKVYDSTLILRKYTYSVNQTLVDDKGDKAAWVQENGQVYFTDLRLYETVKNFFMLGYYDIKSLLKSYLVDRYEIEITGVFFLDPEN